MELKVWVEGVVRVVCGLSLNTSCQDVVITLAQAIGQTGRYVLILKLRGTERHLLANDCPLQLLAQLGQLAAEVQFVLRRTGPSLADSQDGPTRNKHPVLPRHPQPEPLKRKQPQKALTFSLGPSTLPRRTKPNRAWSPSSSPSPEPRASPVHFQDALNPATSSYHSREEAFRQLVKQQKRLQDLEIQLEALERETEALEQETSSAAAPDLEELEELELRLRQNEWELQHEEYWEEQLQAEMDKERDMQRHLDEICLSVDDQSHQMLELQAQAVRLEEDLRFRAQSSGPGSLQMEEVLRPLRQELHSRSHQGEQLEATLSETEMKLQAAEETLQSEKEQLCAKW